MLGVVVSDMVVVVVLGCGRSKNVYGDVGMWW